jgi:hypothetical protein
MAASWGCGVNESHGEKEEPVPCSEKETEVGVKVVAIMQTITEEFDESSKRAWRKMLGTLEEAHFPKEQEQENPDE